MAGSKRQRLKKMLSPTPTPNPTIQNEAVDEDLMDDLFAQLDSRNEATQKEAAAVIAEVEHNKPSPSQSQALNGAGKSSRQRFQEREARKAQAILDAQSPGDAEAEARIELETREEAEAIAKVCKELNLEMFEINPDGHCLFSAVADQLNQLSIIPRGETSYKTTRQAAADYIHSHPDDFLPFLASIDGEDAPGATDTGLLSAHGFETYCSSVRDTAIWGGEPEIMALSRAYNIPIHIVQAGPRPIVVHSPIPGMPEDLKGKAVRISYHRRMYGLGEHYNSLRPKAGRLERLLR